MIIKIKFYTFITLVTTLLPFQVYASDILINSPKTSQSFTENNQTLTINGEGHISGSVTSSFLGSTLTINASGSNGINSASSTAVTNIDTINLNSGRITSRSPFTIINSKDSDFKLNISKNATLAGNNIAIFDRATNAKTDKLVSITNDGLISAVIPIIIGNRNLTLINRGTITSNNNSSAIGYLSSSDQNMMQTITNESSGIINGNIYTFAKDSAVVTNRGVINGNIQVSGSDKSIEIINDGGSIGNSSSIKFISLNTGEKSRFKLVSGNVNANMEVGLNEGGVKIKNGLLLASGQVVDLQGGVYNGNIEFVTGANINLGATDFNGTIKSKYVNGYSLDKGTINVVSNANLDSDVNLGGSNGVSYIMVKSDEDGNVANATYSGASIKSDYLTIEHGSTLNLASNMNVSGLISSNISGTLNFGYDNRSFTGNVIGAGNGTIDLKSGSHNIIGDLSLNSGDILKVEIGANSVGKLTVSGAANIASGVKLDLNVTSDSTLKNSYTTTIIDGGANSSIQNIANSNFSVTSIDIGSYRLVKYDTSVSEDKTDLLLNVSSTALEKAIETDPNNQFDSLKPQDNSSLKNNSLVTINSNTSLIEKRINTNYVSYSKDNSTKQVFKVENSTAKKTTYTLTSATSKFEKKSSNVLMPSPNKKYKLGFSSGDEPQNYEIWVRAFGTKAKQKNSNDNGYNSNSSGVAIGIDTKINKDILVGLTLSNSSSKVSSTSGGKVTNIESYQFNLYGSKFFDEYFISGIIGVTLNKNESNRIILDTSSIANAKFNSYNYVSKLGVGAIYKNVAKSGFDISPELSTTFINTRNNAYFESGAGNFNLAVKRNYDEYLEARFGAEVAYKNIKLKTLSNLFNKKLYFTPKLNASYGYNFLNGKQVTVSNFIGQSATFNTVSANINPSSIRTGISFIFSNSEDLNFTFDYIDERRGGYVSHSAGLKVSYEFN